MLFLLVARIGFAIELLVAGGAHAVREAYGGVFTHVRLQFLPLPILVADAPASGTHGNEASQGFEFTSDCLVTVLHVNMCEHPCA